MRRIWQILVVAFKVVRTLLRQSEGVIISLGYSQKDERIQLLVEYSKWEDQAVDQIKLAHRKARAQLGLKQALQIKERSGD